MIVGRGRPCLAAFSSVLLVSACCCWAPASVAACPCCPSCPAAACPCAWQPSAPPRSQPPELTCQLNCYGEAATIARLPVPTNGQSGAQKEGIEVEALDRCRGLCMASDDCEAVVYGNGRCWGKKEVRTFKCQRGNGRFVTAFVSGYPVGSCTIVGDPHVLTFDDPNGWASEVRQRKAGIYPLVLSSELQIFGRFGFSASSPSAASLTGISAAGMLCGGHDLAIAYTGPAQGLAGFTVTMDNVVILTGGLGDSYESPWISAQAEKMEPEFFHEQARHTIGGTAALGAMPSMVFEIGRIARIYVLLGNDTMNAVITMRKLKVPQSGYCGNFNCDWRDDSLEELERLGLAKPIRHEESLFKSTSRLRDCAGMRKRAAEERCQGFQGSWRDDCVGDVCASISGDMEGAGGVVAAALAGAQELFAWLPWRDGSLLMTYKANCLATLATVLVLAAAVMLGTARHYSRRSVRALQATRWPMETVDDSSSDEERAFLLRSEGTTVGECMETPG